MKLLKSVHELYVTQEFRTLRLELMNERIDGEGLLRCEHCHEVIEQACDCIAHHVKPVTLGNLNNVDITLNPANIQLVHHKCHNEIHERFGYARKKIYYVYGAPLSGKSSWVKNNKGSNDIVVDMDNIWQCITGGQRYYKPDALKTNVFAMRDFLLAMCKENKGFWNNAYIIEGGANKVKREQRLRALGAEPVYIEATQTECLERLERDEQRRPYAEQWRQYINEWFDTYEI
jgi:predicted kinase